MDRADAIFDEGYRLKEAGDIEGAISRYREAARLGSHIAWTTLAYILTKRGPPDWAEGMRWGYRAVRAGDASAAWNLAMEYRIRGNRRRYFHWLKVSARMGEEEAQRFLRLTADIRKRGKRAPMLFLSEIHEHYVLLTLDDFLSGEMTAQEVTAWADLLARGEAAPGPPQSRRVADAIEEMADPTQRLTKKRARELIFKLA